MSRKKTGRSGLGKVRQLIVFLLRASDGSAQTTATSASPTFTTSTSRSKTCTIATESLDSHGTTSVCKSSVSPLAICVVTSSCGVCR